MFLEFIVDGILNGTDGLLYFLDSALENYSPKKNSDTVFIKGFQFLSLLIDNFYQVTCFKQYIHQIKVLLTYSMININPFAELGIRTHTPLVARTYVYVSSMA